jgi:deoxyribonuclease-4
VIEAGSPPRFSRPIGAHLQSGPGLVKAAQRAGEIGARALQLFADNPAAWRRKSEPPAELAAFHEQMRRSGIAVLAIHGPYLVNLATPDPVVWERSLATLVSELQTGAAYGASLVNVHIGSHRGSGAEAGLTRTGEAVRHALAATADLPAAPTLVLENSAGTGDGIGASVEDLAGILEAATAAGADVDRLAFCFDTAHLWGAGHDISDPDGFDALLERFDRLIGLDRLALLHLNDSKVTLGSHLDRHQHVGAGEIGERGLRHLLRHPRLVDVPLVIETPGMDEGYDLVNLERIRHLLEDDGRLPELTVEERNLPGSRARARKKPRHPGATAAG